MRFRVVYGAADELVRDHDQQMVRGGLLVRVPPPPTLAPFAKVTLELDALGARIALPGEVVQLFAGMGVAVGFAPTPELTTLVAKARTAPAGGAPARHELAAQPEPEPELLTLADDTDADEGDSDAPGRAGSQRSGAAAKIHKALHGNRDERAAILRETNRALHVYVLRNPGLGLDEVLAMARMTTLSADLMKQLAERREWISRPDIALALVRNHAVPIPIALRALDHVSPAELKALAKDTRVREPILRAARKKVIKP